MKIFTRTIYTDATRNVRLGEDECFIESFTDEIKRLFRDLQCEHGKCVSRMYTDQGINCKPIPIGYVFEKKKRYSDINRYFKSETWVHVRIVSDDVCELFDDIVEKDLVKSSSWGSDYSANYRIASQAGKIARLEPRGAADDVNIMREYLARAMRDGYVRCLIDADDFIFAYRNAVL